MKYGTLCRKADEYAARKSLGARTLAAMGIASAWSLGTYLPHSALPETMIIAAYALFVLVLILDACQSWVGSFKLESAKRTLEQRFRDDHPNRPLASDVELESYPDRTWNAVRTIVFFQQCALLLGFAAVEIHILKIAFLAAGPA